MPVRKVLVIEDEKSARDALGCLLREDGFSVRTADSGEAGLECAQDFEPDAIVCDYYLPDIDGLNVLRCLRAGREKVFIIVVTGGGGGQGAEEALRAEADLFLEKPVDLSRLRSALLRVESRRTPPPPSRSSTAN